MLAERLRRRTHDPGEVSDAGPELLLQHRAQYERPDQEANVYRVDTTASEDQAADEAFGAFRR